MTVVHQKDVNTVTLSAGFSFLDVNLGVTISNLAQAEVIWDARAGQSITDPDNFYVTCALQSTTVIRLQRGGNAGAMVVHFQVIEYTLASGFIVDRGSATLSVNPLNIAIPSRAQGNRYSRVGVRSSASSTLEDNFVEHRITSNSNLLVQGNAAMAGITVEWQTVYGPDQCVHNFTGNASGTSFNVNVSGFGIVKDESFVVQSMRNNGTTSPGIDPDEIKGAYLNSDINLEIFSFFSDTHFFSAQIVHRPKNRVDRDNNVYTVTPFNIALLVPVVTAESYVHLAAPNEYFATVNVGPTDADEICHTTQLTSPTQVVLQRFINTNTTRLVTEVVYLDGNPITGNSGFITAARHRRCV
jgi:hypothetical protein